MQSFRERGGFQGNQRCYQQEPHELSRLENYRHHSQTGQGYEVHSLSAAGMPTAGTSSKDCYGQQPYPSYGSSSDQSKKPYRGGKATSQHLQAGYSSHVNSGYSSQYLSEGHLQQKWDESGQISQYEPDIAGHLEPGPSGSSQYLEQNILAISQSQCHLPSQPSAPVYTSPHQQGHPSNHTQSPLMYPQSHIHFPQHSQPPSSTSSSSSYMEKCNSIPHGYKSGYGMPPNAQYSRQLGNHSTLKQNSYRPQNNYGYQQPPSRAGFEQPTSLQGMSGTSESLQKFPHYTQTQQNYCITDISVRSPEQYYQNCSPSSSHSPARSVGRSPSYSSTPSPLMPNPDTFQYGQPINPSSTSANLQDPNMLMPPHTHPSPSVNHQPQSYSSSMKDRFSEKLFSNPSLWSLNALTSQVENISNNVQQLLLSEALMANKKCNKRNQPKKGEEYRGHLKGMEDSCPESQHGPLPSDSYGTPRSMPADLLEVGYSSSTEDQVERNYYFFGQGKGPTHTSTHSQLSLDTVSTCSVNSTDDMSVRSGDSDRSIQSAASEDNLSCDPRVQRLPFGEEQQGSLRSIRNERSPVSVTAPSPMKQESNSPIGIKQSESTQKENFEESAWTERTADEKEIGKMKLPTEQKCKGEVFEANEKQPEWLEDEKCPSIFHKLNKEVSNESYSYETEGTIYQNLKNKYEIEEENFAGKCCDTSCKEIEDSEIKSEIFKSESQNNGEDPITESPAISKDVPESNLYLPRKEESSETPYLTSECESFEERLLTSERRNNVFKEQQSAPSYSVPAVRENGSLTSNEDVINNKAKLEESSTEAYINQEETESEPVCVVTNETAETLAQDVVHRSSERTSVTCDNAPQSHLVRSGFSALNEKTTPQNQARDHIDHSDAKVLEPDSPQLPGKSIISSAPSWADTPPSPQKGDEDVEPGISCPSATKPEPMALVAHPRLLGRKHARGRRRLIHSNAGIRSVESNGVPPSPQKPSMLSSNSANFSDQMEAVQLDISSNTPKLLTEGLPSRMCTRSLGSQSTPKVFSQERRKTGPKPVSKPGPKPGLKPGTKPSSKPVLKPSPKQGLKPGQKPGPKPSPKPGAKPSLKPGPKQNLKPGPKPGPKPGAVPSVKPSSKPGAKPAAIPALKQSPKPGLKPTEGVIPKGPGRPKGLNSRIKSVKYENNMDAITEQIEDTSCINETPEQQENTAVSLKTVVDTTLHTSIDSTIGSSLDTALDTSFVNSVAKDQKSMVLRSRKQKREKITEDKEKERDTSTEASAIKTTESHTQKVAAVQPCENQTSTLKSSNHEDICTDSLNEQIVSVSIKRKSSLQAPDPVKKKKNLKVSQTKIQEPQPQELIAEAQGSKGRRKRGYKLESACSTLTKDNIPLEEISDTPCVPPHCPTKTKYLPPRKGRGLKYEAMVQKITSPASKKQLLNIQPDVVLEELASKQSPELQLTEKRKTVNTATATQEEGESTVSIEETPEAACIQTPRKKNRKWATVESSDTPDVALGTGSLIINTPRLAKQRAIKNNHEMHLKQRKKRRKGTELAKSVPTVETHEHTDAFSSPPAPPLSPPTTFSLFPNAEVKTQGEQLSIEISSTANKPKRGRRPSLKKKQEDFGQQIGNEEGQKIKKKPGPKKKIQQNNNSTIKVTVKRLKPKIKCKKEHVPTVKGILTDFLKTQESEGKHSFKPYVHIDSFKKRASLCTIVNKPEEKHLLVQTKKKNLGKNNTISNSSIMFQGPLVNRSLTDRCLICCLCGKPANYRELGDLCGPYYPENTIPRKTLSLTYHEDFRQNRDMDQAKVEMCSTEQIKDMKREGEKGSFQEGTSEGDCRQVMRERRAQLRSHLGLRTRFKRLQLLQGRAGGGVPPAGEEGFYSVLQRLQLEAEVNEHWAHESCTVWTSGVILIADKLYGLKEAAQESTLTKCSKCQSEGASIGCSWKNCIHKYHYVCAKETGCIFDEDTFSIKCPKHQAM